MDQYFYVIREERRNVVVQKPIIRHQQQEGHVKLMMKSDEFPELYHLDMPTHQWEDHCRSSRCVSNMKDYDRSYGGGGCGRSATKPAGKQYSAPPPHQVNVCQGPVAAQAQTRVIVPPRCQDEKVSYYPGNHPSQPPPPPPQVKKPASETVINSNEAARLYGGILIKDFGWNKLPTPAVRF